MNRIKLAWLQLTVGCVLSLSASAQSTIRVSVTSSGGQFPVTLGTRQSVSGDGNRIAFNTVFTTPAQVYVRDTASQQTFLVSQTLSGNPGSASSSSGSISADGRFVAFSSRATNLIPNDPTVTSDVLLRDLELGLTTLVSVGIGGSSGDDASDDPVISGNGRFVAFVSQATNLVQGDTNGQWDVFVRDLVAQSTTCVSLNALGLPGNGPSTFPSLSFDGQRVAFQSAATDLVSGDTNAFIDVFLLDRQLGQTRRVSVATGGAQGNSSSSNPCIAPNGRVVAFDSAASNLVAGDTNGVVDVFVHDTVLSQTLRVSEGTWDGEGDAASEKPCLSFDGRFVAFQSNATNLVSGDANDTTDVFVHDRSTSEVLRASVKGNNTPTETTIDGSWASGISHDGTVIAFTSDSATLVPGDTSWFEVFARRPRCCYLDADQDGFGSNPIEFYSVAPCAAGFSPLSSDCDDSAASIHPGAVELCDFVDNDCNGIVDDGFLATYCTAGTSIYGCVPSISGVGAPSSTASSGFTLQIHNVPAERYGLFFYGSAPTAQIWSPGSSSYFCVFFPISRTGVLDSGGTPGTCEGVFSLDWNAWRSANPTGHGSPFAAGEVFYAQGWYRDPGAAQQTNLSNGLRFTLCD